jgi:hypothetical protein
MYLYFLLSFQAYRCYGKSLKTNEKELAASQ